MKAKDLTYTDKTLNSKKLLLICSLALTLIVNALIFASLMVGGIFNLHAYLVIALIVTDITFIVLSALTNFRFSYSRFLPLIYSGISVIICLVMALTAFKTAFSLYALIAFIASHALSIISLVICALDASKRGIGVKVLAIIFMFLFAFSAGFSTGITYKKGFFGQTSLTDRALTFSHNAVTDTYEVTGTLNGFGKKITIPEKFNGKAVTSLDCKVFKGIEEVTVSAGENLKFVNLKGAEIADNLKIFTPKANVDVFKNRLVFDEEDYRDNAFKIANAIAPSDLADGEVYVTFNADEDQIKNFDNSLIPTWYGKVGDTFNISEHVKTQEYLKDFDMSSETYLYNGYNRNGSVLSKLEVNGESLQNAKINSSIIGASVEFEKVYKVAVGEDNDGLYEQIDFKSFNDTGFRYVTKQDTTNLLSQQSAREGFTLSWQGQYGAEEKFSFNSLKEILKDQLTIYPIWKLNAPSVEFAKTDKESYIYGETVQFTSNAIAPIEGFTLAYQWVVLDGVDTVKATDKNFDIVNALPSQTATYGVRVTASNPAVTTLTSTAEQNVAVAINKRPLGFGYQLPVDLVYSATDKTVTVVYVDEDVINGDVITYEPTISTVKDAGNYTVAVTLTQNTAELYTVKAGCGSVDFEITPYNLTVNWSSENTFTYDGAKHGVEIISSTGLGADGEIEYYITGAQTNAGTYTATASSNNPNYIIENKQKEFTINPKTATVIWSTTDLIYNAENQTPNVARLEGIVDGEVHTVNVSGGVKDVGTGYTATASILSNNYVLTNNTCTFNVAQKAISVNWGATTLVYNGDHQAPKATLEGVYVVDQGKMSLSVLGGMTNVGSGTAEAIIANDNYIITSNKTIAFSITQKQVTVNWANTVLTYNASAQKPSATLSGVVSGDDAGLTVSGEKANVGTGYIATASITNGNYNLANNSVSFRINPYNLTVVWGNNTFTYDGNPHTPVITSSQGLGGDGQIGYNMISSPETKAGTYTAIAQSTNGNYNIANTRSYTINKKAITVTYADSALTYTGLVQMPTPSVSGLVTGDGATVNYNGKGVNAGVHTITATPSTNDYIITEGGTHTYTIAKALLTLTWSNLSPTYNGSFQKPTVSVNGTVNGESTLNLVSVTGATNAGEYISTATVNSQNYYLLAENSQKQFKINKKEITLLFSQANNLEYTGRPIEFIPAVSGGISGDNLGLVCEYYQASVNLNGKPTEIGSYTVKVSLPENSNYIIVGNAQATFNIIEVVE